MKIQQLIAQWRAQENRGLNDSRVQAAYGNCADELKWDALMADTLQS